MQRQRQHRAPVLASPPARRAHTVPLTFSPASFSALGAGPHGDRRGHIFRRLAPTWAGMWFRDVQGAGDAGKVRGMRPPASSAPADQASDTGLQTGA